MGAGAADSFAIRAAQFALATLVFISSFALTAAPLGALWLFSQLDLTPTEFYVSALLGCPIALAGAGWVLLRVNGLYQRAAGTNTRVVLESSITLAVLIALAVITFLFLTGDSGTHLGPCC
jgi:uncharacterized membrane protein